MSRYYCLDESGTIKFPFKKKDSCFVLALLEIRDQKSRYKVVRAVRKTLEDFQKHLEVCHGWPSGVRIPELKRYDPYHRVLSQNKAENVQLKPKLYERGKRKGELIVPGLSSHPDVERRFFYRIAKAENLSIYIAYLDKRALKAKPPKEYDRRYALFLRHLLSSIKHPPKKSTLVIDKRQADKDQKEALEEEIFRRIQESKGRKGKEEVKAELEKEWHARFNRIVLATLYKKFGRKAKIWHRDSKEDKCLQAADSIAHFFRQYTFLGLNLPPHRVSEELKKRNNETQRWFELYDILKRRYDPCGRKISNKLELQIVWKQSKQI